MVIEVFVNEHRALRDCVLHETQITATAERSLHILVISKIGQDILHNEFLVPTSGRMSESLSVPEEWFGHKRRKIYTGRRNSLRLNETFDAIVSARSTS